MTGSPAQTSPPVAVMVGVNAGITVTFATPEYIGVQVPFPTNAVKYVVCWRFEKVYVDEVDEIGVQVVPASTEYSH